MRGSILNAPAEAFDQTSRYIAICGAGSLMIVAYNVLGSIMRGLGDSKTPLKFLGLSDTERAGQEKKPSLLERTASKLPFFRRK